MRFNVIDAATARKLNISADSLKAVSNWHRDAADRYDTDRNNPRANVKAQLDATRHYVRHTVQADLLDIVISKMN